MSLVWVQVRGGAQTKSPTQRWASEISSGAPRRAHALWSPNRYSFHMPISCLSDCTMPTTHGRMTVRLYGERGADNADPRHVWVVCLWANSTTLRGRERVHMRVHDACLTSEVLGSLKCDCAQQLRLAQHHLAQQKGILIYSPQEGRGIGLVNKIAAYALQEKQGLDTVDANLALGLPDEARNYAPVRVILDDLGVRSVVLLTNNPFKIGALRALGIRIEQRRAVLVSMSQSGTSEECQNYLRAKASRMGHRLYGEGEAERGSLPEPNLPEQPGCVECEAPPAERSVEEMPLSWPSRSMPSASAAPTSSPSAALPPACTSHLSCLQSDIDAHAAKGDAMPFVTLTYAQSLDGSIAGPLGGSGPRLMLSGNESMTLTHSLRAAHDAILVGSGTLLADDPQLNVRLVPGRSPLRVILDGRLRSRLTAKALRPPAAEPFPASTSASAASTSAAAASASAAAASSHPLGHPRRPHAVVCTLARTLREQPAANVHALRAAGVRVLCVDEDARGRPCLRSALRQLRLQLGVRSAMIEGGATLIGSCLETRLAHRVIVTIAPKMLVNGLRPATLGSSPSCAPASADADTPLPSTSLAVADASLKRVHTFCLGEDVVLWADGPAAAHDVSEQIAAGQDEGGGAQRSPMARL